MVRHPHFTQPIFVRFPRPPVLSGRDGAEQFPHGEAMALEVAVTRRLRQLDRTVTVEWVKDTTVLVEPAEVLRALSATEIARPADVRAFFRAQFRGMLAPRTVARPRSRRCGLRRTTTPTTCDDGRVPRDVRRLVITAVPAIDLSRARCA